MELDLKAQFQEMERIHPWLMEAAEKYQLPEQTISSLNLCLEEIILNTMKYGYESSHLDCGMIHVRLRSEPPRAIVEIIDNADPFNPLEYRDRGQAASLDETEVGGLGINLVRRFSESMDYRRRDNHNWLQVVFRTDQE
jgi:serine/threonine-protein kinase RsbW